MSKHRVKLKTVTSTVFYWVDETAGISNPFIATAT